MRNVKRVEGYNLPERDSHVCSSDGACRHRYALKPWLPFGPLEALVLVKECAPTETHHRSDEPGLAQAWTRALQSGRVTLDAADWLARDLLGLHPCEVWGEVWWRLPMEPELRPFAGESVDAFAVRVAEWERVVA